MKLGMTEVHPFESVLWEVLETSINENKWSSKDFRPIGCDAKSVKYLS